MLFECQVNTENVITIKIVILFELRCFIVMLFVKYIYKSFNMHFNLNNEF